MRILTASLIVFLILLAALVPVLILDYIGQAFGFDLMTFITSWYGLLFMSLCGIGYAKICRSYVRTKL